MKTYYLSFLLLFQAFSSIAQDTEVLWKKYNERNYEFILEKTSGLNLSESSVDIKLLLGRVYIDLGKPDQGLSYLTAVLEDKQQIKWRTAWADAYLGVAYFQKGNYKSAREHLKNALSLNATETVNKFIKNKMALFGFSEDYENFIVKETEHIVFHFDPILAAEGKINDEFVKIREKSFNNISQFFQGKMPKKIDFFVWSSTERLRNNTGAVGGYSVPEFCISQTVYEQTPGHELTHVISHYHAKILHKSALINEGTAVYLDQTNSNRMERARQILKEADLKSVNIPDIWEIKNINEKAYYAIAGAWVEFLIEKEGKSKFLEFFTNQTFENAKRIYAQNIDSLLVAFHSNLSSSGHPAN